MQRNIISSWFQKENVVLFFQLDDIGICVVGELCLIENILSIYEN